MDLLKIPSYIKNKNYNFILNNFEIFNIEDDFNIIVYFIENFKLKIIIRKFNITNIGWNKELVLKIYNNNNIEYDLIKLGTSNKNYKIMNLKTKIKLIKKKYNELNIPKNIFQTYSNNNYHNIDHYNAIQSLIDLNPDFKYYFYNDQECRQFIIKNYDEKILNSYDKLYPCAYKADFFRYLIIYKYGGIYLDNKYLVRKTLNFILDNNHNLYCKDINQNSIFNSFLISNKNEINYKLIIDRIITNIENNFYGNCPLHPTGPRLFYEYFKNENIKLKHNIIEPKKNYLNCTIKDENNETILNTFYNGYYYNKNHRNELKNDYDYCYRNKLIYLKDFIKIKNYKFSILIEKDIKFDVKIIEENNNILKINCIFKILNINKKINKNCKFIFINDETHDYQEFDLINVINKIFIINK